MLRLVSMTLLFFGSMLCHAWYFESLSIFICGKERKDCHVKHPSCGKVYGWESWPKIYEVSIKRSAWIAWCFPAYLGRTIEVKTVIYLRYNYYFVYLPYINSEYLLVSNYLRKNALLILQNYLIICIHFL